jgi:hypothetical protein
MAAKPILANSCAFAATAAEAAYRINAHIGSRAALILALDADAGEIVDRVAERPWGAARFFHADTLSAERLVEEIDASDVAIMVATGDADAAAAEAIARACFERGIMTAGLILGEQLAVAGSVAALRPYARNLMVTSDEDDVAEVLRALRA